MDALGVVNAMISVVVFCPTEAMSSVRGVTGTRVGVVGGVLFTLGFLAKTFTSLGALSAWDAKWATSEALQLLANDAREPACDSRPPVLGIRTPAP